MTTKPKVTRYRISAGQESADESQAPAGVGNPEGAAPSGEAAAGAARPAQPDRDDGQKAAAASPPPTDSGLTGEAAEIEAIRREGLSARQLRLARRVAQKRGLKASSDIDAVRQLRAQGVDPFQRSNILDLVVPDKSKSGDSDGAKPGAAVATGPGAGGAAPTTQLPAMPSALDIRAGELRKMQREITRRRRRNFLLLSLRLLAFIALPTILAGYYFYKVATPMYATKSEFVIQKASAERSMGGLGSLFQGTSMATQQDSISVQSYLLSREAMIRLDEELGFRKVFSQPEIDPIQRLEPDATLNDAYKVYRKRVTIGYDPTEGLVRMEVSAPAPATSQAFSEALIRYAEEQVDHMTARLRDDQMTGALANYESAEAQRLEALEELSRLKAANEVIDPAAEGTALMGRIGTLESQRDSLQLELSTLLDNRRPNQARVDAMRASIDRVNEQIDALRAEINGELEGDLSRSQLNAEIRRAEENYQFRLTIVGEALAAMETSRAEANRQVRYLSLSVRPIAFDDPSYPRSFENTVVAFAIFAGIYLLISLTYAILREQVG